jgi:hypothetical protein
VILTSTLTGSTLLESTLTGSTLLESTLTGSTLLESTLTGSTLLTGFSQPLTPLPIVGFRLGILFRPVCSSVAKYPVVLLEFDPVLRDYILLSQTFPIQLSPLPPSPATWSATNVKSPHSPGNIDLSIILPEEQDGLLCQVDQNGCELILGVRPPGEFNLALNVSGIVLGSIYVNYPDPLPPPPVNLPLPPPPFYLPPTLTDPTFPPDFEYPPEFLWPSQVHTFYPWYYIMYHGDPLPPLEMLPYIPTELR